MVGWLRGRATAAIVAGALTAVVALTAVALLGARSAEAVDREPQVIGGTAVSNGKYPFVTALYDSSVGPPVRSQFCGGTLIDRDSVLTAAHCVDGSPAAPLRVTVGRTVLSSGQGQTRGVARIFVHPRYNGNVSSAYDAAVLKLSKPVGGIRPVRLATSGQNALETPGRGAMVAGWGNTIAQPVGGSAGASYPDRMREARVPIRSDSFGRQVYGSGYFPGLMVAAGKTGKDTCQGDSGGPMFTRVAGRYTQIGITSFGAGCGAPNHPGVYAEVNNSSIRGFITNAAGQ